MHTTSHHIGNGSHEVMEDLSSTRARINALRGHVQETERSLELVEKAESAAAAIAQAMEQINTEQRLQAPLQARIEQAATRSQGIEEEIAAAQSAAVSAEQAAGQALAQAEDAKAEKAARTQLEKAVELALATEATIRVKRRTIETMEAEVVNMKQQAGDSRQREQVAKAALSEALWSKYAEEECCSQDLGRHRCSPGCSGSDQWRLGRAPDEAAHSAVRHAGPRNPHPYGGRGCFRPDFLDDLVKGVA